MKLLYLDCFAGISGDMFLGALLDLGVPLAELASRLDTLAPGGFRLNTETTVKNGIRATKASVHIDEKKQTHRHLPHILEMINNSGLPGSVKEKSSAAFHHLARAEACVHGISVNKVHFHEVGALDAIVDIVGAVLGLEMLGIQQVVCSPLPLGTGFVKCAHGVLPLPAPAVLELLKGAPTAVCHIQGETVTPTGAALVRTLAREFGPLPEMEIISVGYGAGEADRTIPNVLRAVFGKLPANSVESGHSDESADVLNMVEANIDDMNPEFYEYIFSLLFSAGAVDVFLTPVIMKKGRPGQLLSCLVADVGMDNVMRTMLRETSTLGVRTHRCRRRKLARNSAAVNSPFGSVTVKFGRDPESGKIINIAPEWEDCKSLAARNNVAVKTVYDLAKAEAYRQYFSGETELK